MQRRWNRFGVPPPAGGGFSLGVVAALALLVGTARLPAQTAWAVDPTSREQSRHAFNVLHARSEWVPLQWTGNAATGNAGDTAAAFKEAVRLRINYFRAMAGVPAEVALSPALNTKAQQAALMMAANKQAAASPPSTWLHYSAGGAEAAASSNLAVGLNGPAAITAYLRGEGDGQASLAQRRWLLDPWTRVMGTGDVPAAGNVWSANATWVMDSANHTGSRPATRDPFVAWPPRGYVPYQLVFPRWSLSYPGADFSAATVVLTRGETAVPARLEPVQIGAGENTLVWVYDNLDARLPSAHARPTTDIEYTVTISGVRGAGVPSGFSYRVTVFDPEVPGSEERPQTVNGSITPAVGQRNPYVFFRPQGATAFEWRAVQYAPWSGVYGAEGDLQGVRAITTGAYVVRDTARPDSGGAAYRLAHETAEPQILLLPGTYYTPLGEPGELTFRSQLERAGSAQTARVQVTVDEGMSWRDVWVQAGGEVPSETSYRTRTVSLADYVGRTIGVRFLFSTERDFTPAAVGTGGWWLDQISLRNVRTVETVVPASLASSSTFDFAPGAATTYGLQARGVLPGAYAMEWGPVAVVVGVGPNGAGDPGRLTNIAIRTQAGTGAQTLIMGMSIGGGGTTGNKTLLIRGVGPSLGAFGVSGFLIDPALSVLAGSSILTSNDNWSNHPAVVEVGPRVGAFPLLPDSRDAALVTERSAGGYTVQISGVGGAVGVALAEVYEAPIPGGFAATTPRLTNVSARAQVGSGGDILIAGFTIGGSTEKTVLIRAVGPALGEFGVVGFLRDPKLDVFSSGGSRMTGNDNWVKTASLAAATASVGAFGLPDDSRDAALLITLQPGSYTTQMSGVGNTTGVGLVEIYEVP